MTRETGQCQNNTGLNQTECINHYRQGQSESLKDTASAETDNTYLESEFENVCFLSTLETQEREEKNMAETEDGQKGETSSF